MAREEIKTVWQMAAENNSAERTKMFLEVLDRGVLGTILDVHFPKH